MKFKRQNIVSLIAILLFVLTGIVMQEVLGRSVRTAYISIVMCLALLYIHNQEFSELASDEQKHEQLIKISVDPLTGISSRYAYNQEITNLEKDIPTDLVAISIDINGLKRVNDTLGHLAGDELICGASQCISNTFIKYGKCFRTGGDEFIVFIHSTNDDEIEELMATIKDNAASWHGTLATGLSLSSGYAKASSYDKINIENLISIADQKMYEDKNLYYKKNNLEKR
jgi:diguanylate cyclase (GGDEF)-like protein